MPLKDVVEIPQDLTPAPVAVQQSQPSLMAGVTDRILDRLYSLGRIGKEIADQTGVAGLKPGAERDELKAGRDTLLGTNGKERYQLWPERTVRDALTAAHDVNQSQYGELTSQDLIKPAMDIAAVAGTGGLGSGGGTLNATPSLRPALKFNEKIYKAPPGGQHLDALSPEMYNEFQKLAMKGEDINHYNFGFMNHKGQFLSREKALDYAIEHGLLNPNSEAARAGTLTSTMDLMADSSKPALAVKLLKSPSAEGRFHINDNTGNEIGRLAISPRNEGKDLVVNMIDAKAGENSFGTKTVKDILNQIRQHYPNAERIGGVRVSGTRAKNNNSTQDVWMDLK